jgi:hypothetical protein
MSVDFFVEPEACREKVFEKEVSVSTPMVKWSSRETHQAHRPVACKHSRSGYP